MNSLNKQILNSVPYDQKLLIKEFQDQRGNETNIQLIAITSTDNYQDDQKRKVEFYAIQLISLIDYSIELVDNIEKAISLFELKIKIHKQTKKEIENEN